MLENPVYYENFLAFHMQYLIENKFVKVITDKLTKNTTVKMENIGRQSQGVNFTKQSLLIGKYKVTVHRNR